MLQGPLKAFGLQRRLVIALYLLVLHRGIEGALPRQEWTHCYPD